MAGAVRRRVGAGCAGTMMGVSDTASRRCASVQALWMPALAKSVMVSVTAQKNGGDSFHPMGKVSGSAIKGGSPGRVGKRTASRGICSGCRPTR